MRRIPGPHTHHPIHQPSRETDEIDPGKPPHASLWGHSGTTWASAAGFVGGAVPNYVLNRRWAWPDRRSRDRRSELQRYAIISLLSFVTSVVVTHFAEQGAAQLTPDRGWRVAFIAGAYLLSSGVFFAIKFVAYERLVFTAPAATSPPSRLRATTASRASSDDAPSIAAPTTSSAPPEQSASRR